MKNYVGTAKVKHLDDEVPVIIFFIIKMIDINCKVWTI